MNSIPPLDDRKLHRLCAEIVRRLRAGESFHTETLLEQHPGLADDEEAVVELVYAEHVVREELGKEVAPEEWFARFPRHRERLRRLLELHHLFGEQTESVSGAGFEPLAEEGDGGSSGAGHSSLPQAAFELIEEIGRGGMGVVYKARQLALGRVVALKTILAGDDVEPHEYRRFLFEAEAIARLQHPNILQIYGVGELDGLPYLALEYVEGKNLAEWQKEASPGVEWSARLVETLARAIHHAHRRGVIHRDLKPANVLLAADGTPKVSDFGLAKLITENRASTITVTTVLGTPRYMAPELVSGRSGEVGPGVDVYSLGAILYELLAGVPLFPGTTPLEAMRRVLEDMPKPPSSVRPGVPRDLDTICLKCLEREPRERYASAEDLAEELRRFLADEPILARSTSTWERVIKWTRRRPSEAALAGLAVLVVLGILAVTVWSNAWLRRHGKNLEAALEREQEQTKAVREERARAAQHEHLALRQRYGSHVRLAQNAWDAGHVDLAQAFLEEQHAEPAEIDLRGFEWYYLYALSHRETSILPGHAASISAHALSPSAPLLASGNLHGNIFLRDLGSNRIRTMRGKHASTVLHLVFNPSGRVLASAGSRSNQGDRVKLWDVESGREWSTLPGEPSFVASLEFSSNGQTLIVQEEPGLKTVHKLRLWDLSRGPEHVRFKGLLENIKMHAMSSSRRILATLETDDRIKIREADNGEEHGILPGTHAGVRSLALSSDGAQLAIGYDNRRVLIWNLAAMCSTHSFDDHKEPVTESLFAPDGRILVMREGQRDLTFRDLVSRRKWAGPRDVEQGEILSLSFSPDGRTLITGEKLFCRRWDVALGVETARIPGQVSRTTFCADGRTVLLHGNYPRLRLWHLDPAPVLTLLEGHTARVSALAFSPDGRTLVSGAEDNSLALWNLVDGRRLATFRDHHAAVSALAFSPDSRTIAAADLGSSIKLWDTAQGQELATLLAQSDRIRSVAFSPDGKTVASAGTDLTVRLWDVGSRNCRVVFTEHCDEVRSVAFSPDGLLLASASADGKIILRNVADGRPWLFWQAPDKVRSLAFSPDGKKLASGNEDRTVTIWDTADGQALVTLRGHLDIVLTVAFSPDGETLASGSKDRSVRLWDPMTGQERLTLWGHSQEINTVVFSPDGRLLASGSQDGAIKLWHAPRDDRP